MWESKRIKAVASISQLSALITKITKRMNRKRRNIGHWSSPIKKVLLCKKEEKETTHCKRDCWTFFSKKCEYEQHNFADEDSRVTKKWSN